MGKLTAFGVALDDNMICTGLAESEEPEEFFDEDCYLDSKLYSGTGNKNSFTNYYDNNCEG